MSWNVRSSRVLKVEQELHRQGIVALSAVEAATQRGEHQLEVLGAELAAAAVLCVRNGHDATAAAGGFASLQALPHADWLAVVAEARRIMHATSSDPKWPEALEALIHALGPRPT